MKLIHVLVFIFISTHVKSIDYNLEKNGKICLMVHTEGKLDMERETYSLVHANHVQGNCSGQFGSESSIVLPIGKKNRIVANLTLNFTMNRNTELVYLNLVNLNYKTGNNTNNFTTSTNITMGLSSQYFSCSKFSFANSKLNITLSLMQSKIQAFNVTNNNFSENGFQCSKDQTSTSLPSTTEQPDKVAPFYVEHNESICALVQLNAFIILTNKKEKKETIKVTLAPNHSPLNVTGECATLSTVISIPIENWTLTFNFTRKDDDQKTQYRLTFLSLDYYINETIFPSLHLHGEQYASNFRLRRYLALPNGYYVCESAKHFTLYGNDGLNIYVQTENVQLEMFRSIHNLTFDGHEQICHSDHIDTNIFWEAFICVPIIAIILILIIYLLTGRKELPVSYHTI